jgi:hypothetical protein
MFGKLSSKELNYENKKTLLRRNFDFGNDKTKSSKPDKNAKKFLQKVQQVGETENSWIMYLHKKLDW